LGIPNLDKYDAFAISGVAPNITGIGINNNLNEKLN